MRWNVMTLIFVLFLVGGVLSTASALEKINYVNSGLVPSYSVFWVGVDAGIFKKNGLDVTIITAQSTTSAIQSVLSGEAQLGDADTVGALIAKERGADILTFMNTQKTILFEIFVRNEIKNTQDLKGKKIAISRFGGSSEHMARLMLRKLGLDPNKDMDFLQVGSSVERASALINNSVQAAIVDVPANLKLAKEPSVRLLAKLMDMDIVYPYYSAITTRKYMETHQDVLRAFVKGYLESLKFYVTQKKESVEIISKWLRTKDQEMLDLVHKSTSEVSYMKPYVPKSAEIIYEFAKLQTKKPLTTKWEDTYNNDFVKEWDKAGFIDKLFEGVANVIREAPPHN